MANWNISISYSIDQLAAYSGLAYQSLANSNLGHEPDLTIGTWWNQVTSISKTVAGSALMPLSPVTKVVGSAALFRSSPITKIVAYAVLLDPSQQHNFIELPSAKFIPVV